MSGAAENGQETFAGLNFGVGLSVTHDLGKHDRVAQAGVVNGIVRVDNKGNDVARVMLESHYFFTPSVSFMGVKSLANLEDRSKVNWGTGPFVALQPGGDKIIDAVGIGWMLGFKRNDKADDSSSFNIGIGAVVDPAVKILGAGIHENQALPDGEQDVRFRTTSQWGVLVLTSFAFF